MVCILFAGHGIRLWLYKPPDTIWLICHWIGKGSLCVIGGLCGLYLEMRIFFPDISKSRKYFALNRLALAFGYIWVGCYTVGGHSDEDSETWIALGRITGILAWLVCVGDICIARCSDYEESPPEPLEYLETKIPDAEKPDKSDDDIGYCRNCGQGRKVGHKYCPTCGTQFQPQGDGGPTNNVRGVPIVVDESNPFAQHASAFADLTSRRA